MSDEQLYTIFLKINGGDSNRSIAMHVRNEYLKETKSSIHSLAQGIATFKRRIAHLLFADQTYGSEKNPSSDSSVLDPIEKLQLNERLADLQRARIKRLMREEVKNGVIHLNMSRELHALTAFEKVLNSQREFLVKNRNEDIIHRYKQIAKDRKRVKSAHKVIDGICHYGNTDRILKATDRFLELAEKHALTLEKNQTELSK